jgi:flagellar biosynthesis/type III secretory pathway protein FliH
MSYQPEIALIKKKLIAQLQQVSLNSEQIQFISNAIQDCYDAGYEDGLADGEEISEKPISG